MGLLAVLMQGVHWLVIPLRSRWCNEARAVVARAPSCRPSQLRSTRLVRAVRVCSKGRASPGGLKMLRQPCRLRLCRACMPAHATGGRSGAGVGGGHMGSTRVCLHNMLLQSHCKCGLQVSIHGGGLLEVCGEGRGQGARSRG